MSNKLAAAPVSQERPPSRFPYVTGFCSNGSHEGTKKLSKSGTFMKPCLGTFWIQGKTYECKCSCHEAFRQIAEITGIRAAEVSAPIIGGFLSPTGAVSSGVDPELPTNATAPATGTLGASNGTSAAHGPGAFSRPAVGSRPSVSPSESFPPTPSGQRARGQLEAEVANVVMRWFGNAPEGMAIPLTPDSVRVAITSQPPASNGAIYSVFKRWEQQGFVVLAEKPFRMLNPTDRGLRQFARWA